MIWTLPPFKRSKCRLNEQNQLSELRIKSKIKWLVQFRCFFVNQKAIMKSGYHRCMYHTHTHAHTIHTQTYAYKQWERTLAMQFHLFIYFFQLRCSYSLKYRMQVTPCNFYNHDSSANINICIYFFISWFFLYNKKILIICCGGSKSIKKTLSNINI